MKSILIQKHPEFLNGNGLNLKKLPNLVVDFKLHVYEEVKEKVKEIIN